MKDSEKIMLLTGIACALMVFGLLFFLPNDMWTGARGLGTALLFMISLPLVMLPLGRHIRF